MALGLRFSRRRREEQAWTRVGTGWRKLENDVHLLETQHTEIEKAMTAAMLAIDAGEVSSKATVLATMLNDISRLVDSHLGTEDNEVYPILVKSMDPEAVEPHGNFAII